MSGQGEGEIFRNSSASTLIAIRCVVQSLMVLQRDGVVDQCFTKWCGFGGGGVVKWRKIWRRKA
jgi:hypothetical protein